jgi:hypothetical protein
MLVILNGIAARVSDSGESEAVKLNYKLLALNLDTVPW